MSLITIILTTKQNLFDYFFSIIFVISCVVYLGYTVKQRITADCNAPTISFEEEVFTVSRTKGEVNLLEGMTVYDKEDGDIQPVGRFTDYAVIGIKKYGNEGQSQQCTR